MDLSQKKGAESPGMLTPEIQHATLQMNVLSYDGKLSESECRNPRNELREKESRHPGVIEWTASRGTKKLREKRWSKVIKRTTYLMGGTLAKGGTLD